MGQCTLLLTNFLLIYYISSPLLVKYGDSFNIKLTNVRNYKFIILKNTPISCQNLFSQKYKIILSKNFNVRIGERDKFCGTSFYIFIVMGRAATLLGLALSLQD